MFHRLDGGAEEVAAPTGLSPVSAHTTNNASQSSRVQTLRPRGTIGQVRFISPCSGFGTLSARCLYTAVDRIDSATASIIIQRRRVSYPDARPASWPIDADNNQGVVGAIMAQERSRHCVSLTITFGPCYNESSRGNSLLIALRTHRRVAPILSPRIRGCIATDWRSAPPGKCLSGWRASRFCYR